MTTLKRCSRCRVNKAPSAFHRDASKPDGRRYACRDCVRLEQAVARGGYVSSARAFFANFRTTLDSFAVVDAALNRTPPPTSHDLTPRDDDRIIGVTDRLLSALADGDPAARLIARQKLEALR